MTNKDDKPLKSKIHKEDKMKETTEMIVPVSYDDALPDEVCIKDKCGNLITYHVHGWRRESSTMMTLFVIKQVSE
jgi:hypothetical protein